MQLKLLYSNAYIDYPLDFDSENLKYFIRHETPFTNSFSEWLVAHLDNGDMIYIPCGQNKSRNFYIVTRFFLNKIVQFPQGIFTLPLNYFTTPRNIDITDSDDEIIATEEDEHFIDEDEEFIDIDDEAYADLFSKHNCF